MVIVRRVEHALQRSLELVLVLESTGIYGVLDVTETSDEVDGWLLVPLWRLSEVFEGTLELK